MIEYASSKHRFGRTERRHSLSLAQEGGPLLLPALLEPISGNGEPSVEVRTALAEAAQCMAATEEGFDALWAADAPNLIRKGYSEEEAPGTFP